jgi:hypothetical protein
VKEDPKGKTRLMLVLASSAVDRVFEPRSGQSKDYKIGIPENWKNMIFWRKIVIFHTKSPKKFPASLRSAQFF